VVGEKKANRLGLYDMAGNVHELLQSTRGTYRSEAGGSYHEWTGYDSELFGPYSFWLNISSRREGTRIALIPQRGKNIKAKEKTQKKTTVKEMRETTKGNNSYNSINSKTKEPSVQQILQGKRETLDAIRSAASEKAKEEAPDFGI